MRDRRTWPERSLSKAMRLLGLPLISYGTPPHPFESTRKGSPGDLPRAMCTRGLECGHPMDECARRKPGAAAQLCGPGLPLSLCWTPSSNKPTERPLNQSYLCGRAAWSRRPQRRPRKGAAMGDRVLQHVIYQGGNGRAALCGAGTRWPCDINS